MLLQVDASAYKSQQKLAEVLVEVLAKVRGS
jgi:hypothetical protein